MALDPLFLIPTFFAALLGLIAARTDQLEAKIYDGTTLPMMGIGFLTSAWFFGFNLIFAALLATTLLIFIGGRYLNRINALGGGDVKLLMGYNLLIPFSVFVILPLSMLIASILYWKNLSQYIKLGPLAFISFVILIIASWII